MVGLNVRPPQCTWINQLMCVLQLNTIFIEYTLLSRHSVTVARVSSSYQGTRSSDWPESGNETLPPRLPYHSQSDSVVFHAYIRRLSPTGVLHVTVEAVCHHRLMVLGRVGRHRGLSLAHGVDPRDQQPYNPLLHGGLNYRRLFAVTFLDHCCPQHLLVPGCTADSLLTVPLARCWLHRWTRCWLHRWTRCWLYPLLTAPPACC